MSPEEIRFCTDGMLQSLATWLRLLGYDCSSCPSLPGRMAVERAALERRVFLTRNRHLRQNLPRRLLEAVPIVLLEAERLSAQLAQVVGRFNLDPLTYVFTRCLRCNAPLEVVTTDPRRHNVPPAVVERVDRFWSCAACGHLYWHGSHVRNSLERLRRWLGATVPPAEPGPGSADRR